MSHLSSTVSWIDSLPAGITLEQGPGDLPCLAIDLPDTGKGLVYLYGAHLAQWHPAGQPHPLLWISSRSFYERGKPIRGGVPICFPWFGPHGSDPSLPLHGLARVQLWQLTDLTQSGDGMVRLTLRWQPDDQAKTLCPFLDGVQATYRLELGSWLGMELQVTNRSAAPLPFEEALHPYYAVSDVRQIHVTGVQGATFIDRMQNHLRSRQPAEPIRFQDIFDRSFVNTGATCEIHDPGWNRIIRIAKENSQTTVIWNPAARRAAELADLGSENWSGFVCVETANAAENRQLVAVGQSHRMSAKVTLA